MSRHYRLAIVRIPGTARHSLRIVLATPEDFSDMARRATSTDPLKTELPMFRLTFKRRTDRATVTFPDFYVLRDGIFHAYEPESSGGDVLRR